MNVEQLVQNSIFSAFMTTNLINDLLDLAKLENNAFTLNIENFNLIETICKAFQVVMFQAENQNIRLYLSINANRPQMFKQIFSDKRRTLQILLNFISNSLKFTKSGGFIKISLAVLEEQVVSNHYIGAGDKTPNLTKQKSKPNRKRSSSVVGPINLHNTTSFIGPETEIKYIKILLTIEDTGVGIQQKSLEKLFGAYQRLNEHQGMNAKGTGLGLSICKSLIEQMGGSITVESEVGKGTKFNLTMSYKIVDFPEATFNSFEFKSESAETPLDLSDEFASMFTLVSKDSENYEFIFNTLEQQQNMQDLQTDNQLKLKMQRLKQLILNEFSGGQVKEVSEIAYSCNDNCYSDQQPPFGD